MQEPARSAPPLVFIPSTPVQILQEQDDARWLLILLLLLSGASSCPSADANRSRRLP